MLIGLIVGIAAFVLDGQLAYFTAGQSPAQSATLLALSGFLLFAGALTVAAQANRAELLSSVIVDERVARMPLLAFQSGLATPIVLQMVLLAGADLSPGMTGIEPAMSTAASLALMTGLAAAPGRLLYLNR
jgi:hypothetical protein